GVEPSGRYVTEERLKKMLSHEMNLLEERIPRDINPNKLFFSYANTVATIDFSKKYKGHGWVGINFQLDPEQKEYNEIILHVRFHENRKSTRLNSSHVSISYAVFCLKKKNKHTTH